MLYPWGPRRPDTVALRMASIMLAHAVVEGDVRRADGRGSTRALFHRWANHLRPTGPADMYFSALL